jgi:hydrogenase expression/formation protein HypC
MRAMCLGVPGKVVERYEDEGLPMAVVDFGGIRRKACLAYAPEVGIGSFVVIHVGFAISVVDEQEAVRSYQLLTEMGNIEGVDLPRVMDAAKAPPSVRSEDRLGGWP